MHLTRIKSMDNSPKDYLIEDSGNNNINLRQDFSALALVEIINNNSVQQPLIYGTFTNLEETLQQSLNLGYLLILMLKTNNRYIRETRNKVQESYIAHPKLAEYQLLQNKTLQIASPSSSEIFSNLLAQLGIITRQIEPQQTLPATPNSSLKIYKGYLFAPLIQQEKTSPIDSDNTLISELSLPAL